MTLKGKGIFIWRIPACENGDPRRIASLAEEANFTHVLIKVADTVNAYNIYDAVDHVPPLVRALKARDIQVYGWHYVTGVDPLSEATRAIERVQSLDLDGYVIDAEKEYKQPGKREAAKRFMGRLRESLPNKPIALCSYRYPSYHPQLPWREFLESCDINMPQVYWMMAHDAGSQLSRSVNEFYTMPPYRPIIPVGAAFREHGWQPSPSEVLDFLATARSLNLPAVSFYSWDSVRSALPEVWEVIRDYTWPASPSVEDIPARLIAALNTHDPEQVLAFYNPNAVHLTSARTIQGHDALRVWYHELFTILLPSARFVLSGVTGSGNTRHFSWTATSSLGRVLDGSDTLGLSDGKIAYHYSFFTLSS